MANKRTQVPADSADVANDPKSSRPSPFTHHSSLVTHPSSAYSLLLTPYCFIPALYLLVSFVATWPLITHLRGWVPGIGDWGQNMWALWWTRHALLALGQLPFYTNHLFYPEGVTLLFHPLDLSDGLLVLPLYGLVGGDVSYNLMILLSFVLGGWGTYLLALYLTGNRAASFVAGLVFALSPYHFLRIDLGHLNLSTLQWLPFYLLFLLKFIRSGSRRAAMLAIFFLAFTALNSWYYVAYCGLLSLAVLFWPAQKTTSAKGKLVTRHLLTRLTKVGFILGAALLLLSPLLIPMLRLLGSTTLIGAHDPLRHSVDLLSFWVPGPPSTWAGWFEDVWISYAAQNREPGASAYVGYSVLLLSLVALLGRRYRRQVIWWWAVAVGFTLLALGPQLQLDGQLAGLSLPYQWLATLVPIFSITGIPGRFVVITSLALAVLAAHGLTTISNWLQNKRPMAIASGDHSSFVIRHSSFVTRGLYIGVAVLITVEYLAVPLRLSPTVLPDFYQTPAADRESYAMLDIKWDANFLMHAQTVHQKPLVGGWLARLPAEQAAYLEAGSLDRVFLHLLLGPEAVDMSDPAMIRPAIQTALAKREVRYIIDHGNVAGPWLEQLVGWPVVYNDDDLVVYGVEK